MTIRYWHPPRNDLARLKQPDVAESYALSLETALPEEGKMIARFGIVLTVALCGFFLQLHGVPVSFENDNVSQSLEPLFSSSSEESDSEGSESLNGTAPNGTHQELYVVKAIVYEVGILVNVPDNETDQELSNEEQVDVTFYSSSSNKSHINLGDIPLPVVTSVNGQVLTGIAPVHVGAVSDLSEVLQTLPFTGSIVNITQTNSSYVELSKHNISSLDDSASVVSIADLASLPIKSPASHPLIPTSLDDTISHLAEVH
ncbi:uncharacterized protein LOC128736328 [Sabethes cyaneus]|uniref:uncharacterized protein LOC128736328 n=1 Tax=Sabethes cyaneus TaxID=53552 RepID=UPI00237ED67F|nr:uncharacterized protein LOC128736328 [Sabethes cyaneus]